MPVAHGTTIGVHPAAATTTQHHGSGRSRERAALMTAIDDPTDISGCVAWWDAADDDSFTIATDRVTDWTDRVNSRVLAQAVTANKPTRDGTLIEAGATGKKVVTFASDNPDWLDSAVDMDTLMGADWVTERTYVAMLRVGAVSNTVIASPWERPALCIDGGLWHGILVHETAANPKVFTYDYDSTDHLSPPPAGAVGSVVANEKYVVIARKGDGLIFHRINGVNSPTDTVNATGGGGTESLRLGANLGAPPLGVQVDLCEFVMYDRLLTNQECVLLEDYYRDNWYLFDSAFSPDQVTGTTLWLDASQGVSTSAGLVDDWTDQINSVVFTKNGAHPVQAGTFNGEGVVAFINGNYSDRWLVSAGANGQVNNIMPTTGTGGYIGIFGGGLFSSDTSGLNPGDYGVASADPWHGVIMLSDDADKRGLMIGRFQPNDLPYWLAYRTSDDATLTNRARQVEMNYPNTVWVNPFLLEIIRETDDTVTILLNGEEIGANAAEPADLWTGTGQLVIGSILKDTPPFISPPFMWWGQVLISNARPPDGELDLFRMWVTNKYSVSLSGMASAGPNPPNQTGLYYPRAAGGGDMGYSPPA